MKQEIKIPYYTNCYGLSDLPCVDLLLAAAAGHFSTDNYFHYSFFEAIRSNWIITKKNTWLEDKQEKLNLFGIGIKEVSIRDANEFHKKITSHLDLGEIILLPLKLNHLFYTWAYGEAVPMDHFVLVTGYNINSSTYIIRDSDINADALRPIIQGNPIYKLNVPMKMLCETWEKSNNYFQGNPRSKDKMYTIYDNGTKSNCITASDLLEELFSFGPERSQFISFIKDFNNQLDNTGQDFEKCRRTYHGAARVIVDYIERFCFGEDIRRREEFQNFSKVFINNRYKQLAVLHASCLRNKKLDEAKISSMCHVNSKAERQLFSYIYQGLQMQAPSNLQLVNCAPWATASADSVCIPPDRPQDEYKYYAQNAVTGAYEGWRSNKESAEHWINLVLPTPKGVRRITIFHDSTALTKDYTVSLKDEHGVWKKIASRKNNCEVVDKIQIDEVIVCEVRIDITVPDLNDYYARIRKIEVWSLEHEY